MTQQPPLAPPADAAAVPPLADEGMADCVLRACEIVALIAPFGRFFSVSSSVAARLSFKGLTLSKASGARTHALRLFFPLESPSGRADVVRGLSARRLDACVKHLPDDTLVHLDLTPPYHVGVDVLFPYGPACLTIAIETRRLPAPSARGAEEGLGELGVYLEAATHTALPLDLLQAFFLAADALDVLCCHFDIEEGHLVISCSEERRRPHSRTIEAASDLQLRYPLNATGGASAAAEAAVCETSVHSMPVSLMTDLFSIFGGPSGREVRLGLYDWGIVARSLCSSPIAEVEAEAVVLRRPAPVLTSVEPVRE